MRQQERLVVIKLSAEQAQTPITMDKQPAVVFRNVGQKYFPQTRVECHYSLSPQHQWSSSDWIGIFEVGWSSLRNYHTYIWALVPESYTEGAGVNCCVHFQACYLPRPGAVEYEFVYVDRKGEACARSRPFTFSAPKPLEELETLKEEQDEEGGEGEEEMLLVIPRAQLLQSRLEESLKKQAELQQALDAAKQEVEAEKESCEQARQEWEREREAIKEEMSELRHNVRQNYETMKKMEGKHKDVKYSQESLTAELSKLMAEKADSLLQIQDLEEDVKILNDREKDGNAELERLRERVKKMSSQMKHDEEKRKSLQAESEAAQVEVQALQERLEAGEHVAESMRRELRELGTRQGHAQTELHQARLQVAQLTLQLSEENLLLREERANWALEREAYKHAAEMDKNKFQELGSEVQRKEEWLQDERMEREKLEAELTNERDCNRDLLTYIRQLEERLENVADAKSDEESPGSVSAGSSSSEGEEEADEGDASPVSARSIRSPLFLSAHPERPGSPETQSKDKEDTPASDTQGVSKAVEAKRLILPELVDPILSELADSPMW